jgi:hypothetical protein
MATRLHLRKGSRTDSDRLVPLHRTTSSASDRARFAAASRRSNAQATRVELLLFAQTDSGGQVKLGWPAPPARHGRSPRQRATTSFTEQLVKRRETTAEYAPSAETART